MTLRPATEKDAKLLYLWRMDGDAMVASMQRKPFTIEEHKLWLKSYLAMDHHHLYLAEVDGQAVGTGRIEKPYKTAWLSWTIGAEWRRRGFGTLLAKQLILAATALGYGTIGARVRMGNAPSMKIARRAGLHVLWMLP